MRNPLMFRARTGDNQQAISRDNDNLTKLVDLLGSKEQPLVEHVLVDVVGAFLQGWERGSTGSVIKELVLK